MKTTKRNLTYRQCEEYAYYLFNNSKKLSAKQKKRLSYRTILIIEKILEILIELEKSLTLVQLNWHNAKLAAAKKDYQKTAVRLKETLAFINRAMNIVTGPITNLWNRIFDIEKEADPIKFGFFDRQNEKKKSLAQIEYENFLNVYSNFLGADFKRILKANWTSVNNILDAIFSAMDMSRNEDTVSWGFNIVERLFGQLGEESSILYKNTKQKKLLVDKYSSMTKTWEYFISIAILR